MNENAGFPYFAKFRIARILKKSLKGNIFSWEFLNNLIIVKKIRVRSNFVEIILSKI